MKNIITVFVLLILGFGGYLIFRGSSNVADIVAPGTSLEGLAPARVSGVFKRGEQAPDVQFTDFQGKVHNLSDYAGKAVIVDFWAAW